MQSQPNSGSVGVDGGDGEERKVADSQLTERERVSHVDSVRGPAVIAERRDARATPRLGRYLFDRNDHRDMRAFVPLTAQYCHNPSNCEQILTIDRFIHMMTVLLQKGCNSAARILGAVPLRVSFARTSFCVASSPPARPLVALKSPREFHSYLFLRRIPPSILHPDTILGSCAAFGHQAY